MTPVVFYHQSQVSICCSRWIVFAVGFSHRLWALKQYEYYSSIDRSSGADCQKAMPAPIDQSGNQRVMSQKVSAGKPRQSQPEHEWSRKTQTGQTQRQHFDKIFLQTYFGAFSLHCWHGWLWPENALSIIDYHACVHFICFFGSLPI